MAKILITGANSFVGRNYQKFSVYRSIEEVSLIDLKPNEIDFTGFDIVLHLAAIVHISQKIPDENYYKINRDLCLDVAKLAKKNGIKHFIFLSTTKVYGKFVPGSLPWNEISYCQPDEAYGKSKYEAELGLKELETPDFIVSILRTPLIYGDGVKANMLNLIHLVEKFPVLPFRNIRNSRHFTYIENLVGFIDRIIERKASGTFIAMDEFEVSTSMLVQQIALNLRRNIILITVPDIIIKIGFKILPVFFERLYGSFKMDNSLTKKILDYSPLFTTAEGIRNMILSYTDRRERRI